MAIYLLLAMMLLMAKASAQPNFINHFCIYKTGNFTADSTYKTNLDRVLSSIATNKEIDYGFYKFSYGQSPDAAYAIGLCRADVKLDACRSCLNDSIHLLIKRCPNQKEAIGCYENCSLHYSNRVISDEMDIHPMFLIWSLRNVSKTDQFVVGLRILLNTLKNKASSGGSLLKYAAGNLSSPEMETIYALVQCLPDLSPLQCDDCLSYIFKKFPTCCSRFAGILTPSCIVNYKLTLFFDPTIDDPPTPPPTTLPSPPPAPPLVAISAPPSTFSASPVGKKKDVNTRVHIVIIIVLSVLSCWVLIICIYMFLRSRKREGVDENDEVSSGESLQFDFNTIRDATDNFSDANKLGQGGFGVVYKAYQWRRNSSEGLSHDSEQGDSEFKNELLLVANLRHRNLVRLLGFCLRRSERLLIYELMPNSSLDRFIFDPIKRRHLDWIRRYQIIVGITRGLVYLHEGSRLKIIHHDLKASNILLDAELNPKISDFNMARLFSIDQTRANTYKIMGTYGYMAPEYAIHDYCSLKSDVFSFGVLLLEIVSGPTNSTIQDEDNIVHLISYAWEKWREGTIGNIIDPTLHSGSINNIIRCIHIGLLCVQEEVASRPTMAAFDLMLNSNSTLPAPSHPGFFMHSNVSAEMPLQSDNTMETTRSNQSESVNRASISILDPR